MPVFRKGPEVRTVIALHGFTGGGSDFAPLVEALPELNWVTPDMPGHALDLKASGTPSDDCSLETSLRYLDEIVQKNSGESPILLGYSLGGRLALRYALTQPKRIAALVLVGTSPGIEDKGERTTRKMADDKLAEKILSDGVAAFIEDWQKRPLIATQALLPEAWRTAMRERRLRQRKEGLAACLKEFGQGVLSPALSQMTSLRVPTLISAGVEDVKYVEEAKTMQARCPQAELFIVPNAGHLAHLENRDAFAAALRAFLNRIK